MRGITFLGWTVNIFVACLTINNHGSDFVSEA